jgi:hypothetical protein
LITIQNILTLAVIISLIVPLQYHTLKFANGETKMDSNLVMYNDNNSKHPVLIDSKNTILKPKIAVSIEGTPNDDLLKGGDGDDKINGEDGDDTISGKKGNDKINGGKNDDVINGELGNDTLKGGNGDDKISGEDGNDLMDGGKGDDVLLAGKGDEGILGNEGNDLLNGGEGVDIMAGGTGNDTFICDLFDTIIDFNLNEGDQIIGQCSSLDQTQVERSYDDFIQHFLSGSPSSSSPRLPESNHQIPQDDFQLGPPPPPPPSFDPNNIPSEEFKLPLPPPLQQQQKPSQLLASLPPFSHDDIPSQDFGSFPPYPVPPSNEVPISGPYFN